MSTPTLPYGTAATGSTATDWADAILSALGAPATQANVNSLVGWFHNEGGGGQNNPLNTTQSGFGALTSINSQGVKSYSTPSGGAQATAATLENGLYPGILSALKSGNGLIGSTSAAVSQELLTWSGGHYSSVSGAPGSTVPVGAGGPSGSTLATAGGGSAAAAANSGIGAALTGAGPATATSSTSPLAGIAAVWNSITGLFSGTLGIAEALGGILAAITELGGKLDEIFNAFLWFLYPSHWIRIFLIMFGVFLLIPGAYGLMHTGTGDMYLAMGIALTTMAGILFFLGFHNIPTDIQNVTEFVGWLADGIRTGTLDTSGAAPPSGFGQIVSPATAAQVQNAAINALNPQGGTGGTG